MFFEDAFDLLPEVCRKFGGVSIPLNVVGERVEYLSGQPIFDDAASMLLKGLVIGDEFLDAVLCEFLFDEVDDLPRCHRVDLDPALAQKVYLFRCCAVPSQRVGALSPLAVRY